MKKSRASLEPFWDSKISKYLMRVSSEYIHYKLSATFSEKHCWLNFTCFLGLRNAVDSLALYIARIITRGWPARDCSSATNLKFGRNTVLSSSSL